MGSTKPLNRNEYQDYFLGGKDGQCTRLTTLQSSCANCLQIWESQPPGTLKACTGIALPAPTYVDFFHCHYVRHQYI